MTEKHTNKYDIYMGDCREVLARHDMAGADMVLTDPPYGVEWTGASHKKRLIHDDKPPLWAVGLCHRLLKDKAACCMYTGWQWHYEFMTEFRRVFDHIGPSAVWAKNKDSGFFGNRARNLMAQAEYCIIGFKGDFEFYDPKKRCGNIFFATVPHKDYHPTVKPLPMLRALIEAYCPPGGTVVDPFMGSGSTGVAAMQTGRRFIGCEIEEKYYKVAQNRIDEIAQQYSLFDEAEGLGFD